MVNLLVGIQFISNVIRSMDVVILAMLSQGLQRGMHAEQKAWSFPR